MLLYTILLFQPLLQLIYERNDTKLRKKIIIIFAMGTILQLIIFQISMLWYRVQRRKPLLLSQWLATEVTLSESKNQIMRFSFPAQQILSRERFPFVIALFSITYFFMVLLSIILTFKWVINHFSWIFYCFAGNPFV